MQESGQAASQRAAIAVIVVAGLAVLAAGSSWLIARDVSKSTPDTYGVQASLVRFSAIRDAVPKGAQIGYLSDLPLKDTAGTTAFLAAQYALAPAFTVPVETATYEWAVGNFSHPVDYAAVGTQAGYQFVKDYGGGVILYRRGSK